MLALLGDPDDDASLRSRTVVVSTSDHGELGLSHGGLRQKMFNAYEETLRVPLVVSNPKLFPQAQRSDALVSLVDLVPTLLGLSGAAAGDADQFDGIDQGPVLRGERETLRDSVLFTYDDHQAGTSFQDAAGPAQPHPLRARRALEVRGLPRPHGPQPAEYELYDLEADPDEALNLLVTRGGRGRTLEASRQAARLHALLEQACAEAGVTSPPLRAPGVPAPPRLAVPASA